MDSSFLIMPFLSGVLITHGNLTAISVGAGEQFDGIVTAGDRTKRVLVVSVGS